MVTVYGSTPSGNCWKVRQILDLSQTPYRWVETDSNAGATRTAEFLAMNPNGKVPLVELDDGARVTESNAILAHFAEGSPWLPPVGLPRTRVFEWLFFEQYSHEPYVAVARNWIRYLKAKERFADRLPEIWQRGHRALGVMELRLASCPWLTDSGMTIADIDYSIPAIRLFNLFHGIGPATHVTVRASQFLLAAWGYFLLAAWGLFSHQRSVSGRVPANGRRRATQCLRTASDRKQSLSECWGRSTRSRSTAGR